MLVKGLEPEYKTALCNAVSAKLPQQHATLEDCFYAVSLDQLAGYAGALWT